jgi:hypothetical protein
MAVLKQALSYIVGRNTKRYNKDWEAIWQYLSKLHSHSTIELAVPYIFTKVFGCSIIYNSNILEAI